MKTVVVIFACTIVMSLACLHVQAQLPHGSIFVHALYATPLDKSSKDFYNGGIGVVGGVTLGTKNSRAVASIGYTNFFADNGKNPLGNENYIPVKIGLRQYLPLTLHLLFIQGDLGAGFISNKNSSDNDTRFAYDIGAGVHFTAFEAAVIWDNFKEKSPYGTASWLTLRAGINLGF